MTRATTPYLAIASSRLRLAMQYRAATIAGVGTQLFFGLVRVMIFDAFYASALASASTKVQPMTHAQVITYIWLGQALLLITLLAPDPEVALMIRNGSVVYELTRPIDLYTQWFARAFSARGARVAMRSAPIFVVAAVFLDLEAPASISAGVFFVISAILGLCLAAAMVVLITISLLWTISGEGVSRLAPPLIFFFSGIILPLPLLPDWLQTLILVLPFRGLIDTPIRLYQGAIVGHAASLLALAHQVVWLAVLIAIGRSILARGLRTLVVQGG